MPRQNLAVLVVLASALLWGMWWFPVGLIEGAGIRGPWIGVTMSAAVLPAALTWFLVAPNRASPMALLGGALVGLAVALYAMATSYTDFIRAVLLFYLAPTWSTLIELIFMGRRWRAQSLLAIGLSLAGVFLITRGEFSFDGLGATGDWMAIASGLTWSAGMAIVFSQCKTTPTLPFVFVAIGGVLGALVIAAFDGSFAGPVPDPVTIASTTPWPLIIVTIYVGPLLAGAIWGGMVLPPAVVTYLLSVEVLAGVASAALILSEPFGLFEVCGTLCILGAVLIEVAWTPRVKKPGTP